MSKTALGTLLVSLSACSFGTYSYFALLAAKPGVGADSLTLLMLRFGIAAPILALCGGRVRFDLRLVGLGALYVGQAYTYLQCLLTSSAITASLLLYLYPAFVTIGSILFLHEKMSRLKAVALACALAGSLLIIGPVAEIRPLAIAYGLATAVFYAAYLVAGKRVLETVEPMNATLVIIGVAFVSFAFLAFLNGPAFPRATEAWIGVVGLAIIATVVAIGALLVGLRWISPVEASSLSALEPLVTAIIAVAILGQVAHWWHFVGGALVILAVLLLARQPSGSSARPAPGLPRE